VRIEWRTGPSPRSTPRSDSPISSRSCAKTEAKLEAGASGCLPKLVSRKDIKADLHIHTSASDGSADFEAMGRKPAGKRNYTHIAIADHSASAGYAGGLSGDALLRHWRPGWTGSTSESRGFISPQVLRSVTSGMTAQWTYPRTKCWSAWIFVIGSIHQGL